MKRKSMLMLAAIMLLIIMPFKAKAAQIEIECDYKKVGLLENTFYNLQFTIDNDANQLVKSPKVTFTSVEKDNSDNYDKKNVSSSYSVQFSTDGVNKLISGACPTSIRVNGNTITDYTIPDGLYLFNNAELEKYKEYYTDYDNNKTEKLSDKTKEYYGSIKCDYKYSKSNMDYYYNIHYILNSSIKYDLKEVYYTEVTNKAKISVGNSTSKTKVSYTTNFNTQYLYNNPPNDPVRCPNAITIEGSTVKADYDIEIYQLNGKSVYNYYCGVFKNEAGCKSSKSSGFACVWNETKYGNYCNTDNLLYVSCGSAFDIPYQVPGLVSFGVNLLKIATPIVLIITAIISLVKALAASKEDDIKKVQTAIIKKVIMAALVFFIISIVQFVMLKVADGGEKDDLSTCMSCMLNNDCEANVYYKTNVGGTYFCTYVNGSGNGICKGNKTTSRTNNSTTESSSSSESSGTSSSGTQHGGGGR